MHPLAQNDAVLTQLKRVDRGDIHDRTQDRDVHIDPLQLCGRDRPKAVVVERGIDGVVVHRLVERRGRCERSYAATQLVCNLERHEGSHRHLQLWGQRVRLPVKGPFAPGHTPGQRVRRDREQRLFLFRRQRRRPLSTTRLFHLGLLGCPLAMRYVHPVDSLFGRIDCRGTCAHPRQHHRHPQNEKQLD